MGQYFGAYIEDATNPKKYNDFFCQGCLKLMEHAYLKNDMVNEVMFKIYKTPSKVAWIGDYSKEEDDCNFGLSASEFREKYNRVWKYDSCKTNLDAFQETPEEKLKLYEELSHAFVVNDSKKCYISLDEYAKAYKKETDNSPWVVHPLVLLTACGNGRGGGDFHTQNQPFLEDVIGSWAFDTIYATHNKKKIPSDYENVSTNWLFIED